MLSAKKFYLKQLENGPKSHREITKKMSGKFTESAAEIKNELVAQGVIEFTHKELLSNKRYGHFHKLTGKNLVEIKQDDSTTWEDGTPKSTNNFFNWRNKEQAIFTNREIVIAQQVYQHHHPVTVYSRA